ncbi:MAG: hypothetical protein IVW52_05200 [Acidimicrobiales bacterium]|nr:hypothetical protein [Acidimicrobiales bacterium]
MVNSTSTARASLTLALSTPVTYLATIALIALTVVGTYAVHVLPAFMGYVGITTGVLALLAFLVQDLMAEQLPTGWPTYTTFVVVSAVAALEAGVGVATSTTFVTLSAFIAWALVVTQAFVSYLNQDQGTNIPIATEMQIVVLLGFLITVLTSVSATGALSAASVNASSLMAGLTVTGITSFGGYVFAKESAAAKARRAKASAAAPG